MLAELGSQLNYLTHLQELEREQKKKSSPIDNFGMKLNQQE